MAQTSRGGPRLLGAGVLPSSGMSHPAASVRDASKRIRDGRERRTILENVSFDLARGELVVLSGPSGSGKTTLLAIVGAMLSPTSGEVLLDGEPTSRLRESHRAQTRRAKVGFLFQDLQLVDGMTARENVLLPRVPDGVTAADEARAEVLLARFGVASVARSPRAIALGWRAPAGRPRARAAPPIRRSCSSTNRPRTTTTPTRARSPASSPRWPPIRTTRVPSSSPPTTRASRRTLRSRASCTLAEGRLVTHATSRFAKAATAAPVHLANLLEPWILLRLAAGLVAVVLFTRAAQTSLAHPPPLRRRALHGRATRTRAAGGSRLCARARRDGRPSRAPRPLDARGRPAERRHPRSHVRLRRLPRDPVGLPLARRHGHHRDRGRRPVRALRPRLPRSKLRPRAPSRDRHARPCAARRDRLRARLRFRVEPRSLGRRVLLFGAARRRRRRRRGTRGARRLRARLRDDGCLDRDRVSVLLADRRRAPATRAPPSSPPALRRSSPSLSRSPRASSRSRPMPSSFRSTSARSASCVQARSGSATRCSAQSSWPSRGASAPAIGAVAREDRGIARRASPASPASASAAKRVAWIAVSLLGALPVARYALVSGGASLFQ